MSKYATDIQGKAVQPRVCLRLEKGEAPWTELAFTESFCIGREDQCEVRIDSALVSRTHAEVVYEEGAWWINDRGSTNGVFVDGEKTQRARLDDGAEVQLGRNGPIVRVSLETGGTAAASPPPPPAERPEPRVPVAHTFRDEAPATSYQNGPSADKEPEVEEPEVEKPEVEEAPRVKDTPREKDRTSGADRPSQPPDPSVSQIIERYFDPNSSQPAGERTMLIRRAYTTVKKKQQKRYTGLIVGMLVLLLVAMGIGAYLAIQNQRLEAKAADIFAEVKQQDLEAAQLRRALLGKEDADLTEYLERIEERRRRLADAYDGYVEELGLHRRLDDEERLIYQTARIFNESEVSIPAGFVRAVRDMIHGYWLTPGGRAGYTRSIEQANQNGYTRLIVETMQKYGLPPEFFYLALQESRFDPQIVGIQTRWGIAKGMWQFIPSTGNHYDLEIGPRADLRVYDPLDERHDPAKATDAAARYLLYIYSTPAQASGLLVMASYNWGEHRVISKLQDMDSSIDAIEAAFEGIEQNPEERNYWRFLQTYEERMPEETKDYVLKIFSAAVIGQNPRYFGLDFDNPLQPYMEQFATAQAD